MAAISMSKTILIPQNFNEKLRYYDLSAQFINEIF